MQYTLKAPSHIQTLVDLPASKSISNRALILNALAGGTCALQNLSDCDDTNVLVNALRDMPADIDINASGSSFRFLTAYLSITPGIHTLTGNERLRRRPIKPLVDALRYLGADIEYIGEEGFAPLRIHGNPLEGGRVEIDAGVSSQITSALLLIGPALKNGLELVLQGNIVSRSYIDLTLHIMHDFGLKAEWTDFNVISTPHQDYQPHSFIVENDWSASSYWYEIMALSDDPDNEIQLTGLLDSSRQGDSVVRYLFSMLGVKTVFEEHEQGIPTMVTLRKTLSRLPRLDYDFVNQPDLAQTVVVCCAGFPHYRNAQTGLCDGKHQRLRDTLERRALQTHDTPDRYLSGPPHGPRFRSPVHQVPWIAHQRPLRGQQIVPRLLASPGTSRVQHSDGARGRRGRRVVSTAYRPIEISTSRPIDMTTSWHLDITLSLQRICYFSLSL